MDSFSFISIQNRILEYENLARAASKRKHRIITVIRKERPEKVSLKGEKTVIVPEAKNA